jgi:GTP-binding protein
MTTAQRAPTRTPIVAVVGRPNVGKSSLVNRIIGRREAIVEATPGVTRDRRGFAADWNGRSFELVDTGGLEPGAEGLEARVTEQAHVAIETADVVMLVVDAQAGPQQDDIEVASLLRKAGKRVLLVANKVDDAAIEAEVPRFYRLGLGDPEPVSALHGRRSGDLLDRLVKLLPEAGDPSPGDWAAAAIVGRPNVGKSSLLNRLVGEARSIVDAAPGTTRDPTDTVLELDGDRTLRLVDTAGLRRRTHIDDPLEYFSSLRTRGTLRRVDVAVLVIDATEGVTGPDQRLAEEIAEHGRGCIVALNKWDLMGDEYERSRFESSLEQKLRFLMWAPMLRVSALRGRGVQRILPAVEAAVGSHRHRIPTAEVNEIVRDAQERRPHPRLQGRAIRVKYAVQAEAAPPLFLMFANGRVSTEYVRYLENRLREVEPFTGTPIRIETRLKR